MPQNWTQQDTVSSETQKTMKLGNNDVKQKQKLFADSETQKTIKVNNQGRLSKMHCYAGAPI